MQGKTAENDGKPETARPRKRVRLLAALTALWKALVRFDSNHGWIRASHVAMSIMLALFPFALFVVALAGVLAPKMESDALVGLLFQNWPQEIAEPLATEIRAVLEASNLQLMTLGAALALWFASNGVEAVRIALGLAYRDADPRPFWKTRALSLAFVLVGGAAALAGLTINIGLPAYFDIFAKAMPEALATFLGNTVLNWTLTLGVLCIGVAACHVWLPGLPHGLRDIWPGVLLTVGLWAAAVKGFSFYMGQFADYGATYAGLAGAMAGLIFLYLLAVILIIGAEFNGALLRARDAG